MGDINTGGGANVGKDVSAGNDYVGRDKHNVGDGAVYGSNVNIHQNEQPIEDFTDRELLRKILLKNMVAIYHIKPLKKKQEELVSY